LRLSKKEESFNGGKSSSVECWILEWFFGFSVVACAYDLKWGVVEFEIMWTIGDRLTLVCWGIGWSCRLDDFLDWSED
jgi:hypothetical protein